MVGLLQGRQRLEALADADVLVYPAEQEIFGLVPLEALLTGTPVVVADDSGCGEVVSTVGGGTVIPARNIDALMTAIAGPLDDPERHRAAATAAAVRVRERYSREAVCRALEEVYLELCPSSALASQPSALSRSSSRALRAGAA